MTGFLKTPLRNCLKMTESFLETDIDAFEGTYDSYLRKTVQNFPWRFGDKMGETVSFDDDFQDNAPHAVAKIILVKIVPDGCQRRGFAHR